MLRRTVLLLPLLGIALAFGTVPGSACAQDVTVRPSPLREGLRAFREGQFERAVPLLREAVSTGSARPRAHAALALALLRTDAVSESERVVTTALDQFGPQPVLRLARAEILVGKGALEEALAVYQSLDEEVGRTTSSSEATPLLDPEMLSRRMGRVHQRLGTQAFSSGDTVRAKTHLEAARSHVPDAPAVYANLAVVYLTGGDPERGLSMAEKGLERTEDTSGVRDRLLRVKASALEKTGNRDALPSVYRGLAERNPQDVAIQIGYAQALVNARKHEEGLKHFRDLLDRFPREKRVYDALIDLYDRFGNTKNALQILRRMQRQFPEDPSVLRRIANRLETLRRLKAARAAYDSVLIRTGDTVQVTRDLARTFEAQDSLSAAAAQYRVALQHRPASETLRRDLGRVLERRKAWPDALAVYRGWSAYAEGPAPWLHQGRVYEHRGQIDSAMVAYAEAVERGTDHPLPHTRLARIYDRTNRPDSAFQHAVTALRLGLEGDVPLHRRPPDSVDQSAGAVRTAQQRRRRRSVDRWRTSVADAFHVLTDSYSRSRIEPVLESLLTDHPGVGPLHVLVGQYYESNGDLRTAQRHLRRAAELMPRSLEVHLARGRVSAANGDTTAAMRSYKRAFGLSPGNPDATEALIRLSREQGRLDTLIEQWRRRYETRRTDALHESLIEALHKAERYEAARALARTDSTAE